MANAPKNKSKHTVTKLIGPSHRTVKTKTGASKRVTVKAHTKSAKVRSSK